MSNLLQNTAAVILAAGRGTRMKAKRKNKVAFALQGEPMIAHTVRHLREAQVGQILTVVGFAADSVREALGDQVEFVVQHNQLGTGDALKCALPELKPSIDIVLSVYGDDSAFYPPSLFGEMVAKLRSTNSALLFLTVNRDNPFGLGRIVRGAGGQVEKIVEEKNATEAQKAIHEINTGFYCFDRAFLTAHIDEITLNPVSGEYYLTDMVEIALRNGQKVETYLADSQLWHGVNNRRDYALAQHKIRTGR